MSNEEQVICKSFGNIVFLPGSWNKRFGMGLYHMAISKPEDELTEKQREWMYRILYTYRRQVGWVYEKYGKGNIYCNKIK